MADIAAASADSTLPSPLQIPEFKRPDVMTAGDYVAAVLGTNKDGLSILKDKTDRYFLGAWVGQKEIFNLFQKDEALSQRAKEHEDKAISQHFQKIDLICRISIARASGKEVEVDRLMDTLKKSGVKSFALLSNERPTDMRAYLDYCEKKAQRRSALAINTLGCASAHGWTRDGQVDMVMVFQNFEEAAKRGSARAFMNLGINYLNGQTPDGEKDIQRAFACFESAASMGFSFGYHQLGVCYLNGQTPDGQKDFGKAISYFEKVEKTENVDALFNLGVCYQNGWTPDGQKDFGKAISYFEKVENVEAFLNLGVCYQNKEISKEKKDFGKVAYYFKKAVQKMCTEAFHDLGLDKVEGWTLAFFLKLFSPLLLGKLICNQNLCEEIDHIKNKIFKEDSQSGQKDEIAFCRRFLENINWVEDAVARVVLVDRSEIAFIIKGLLSFKVLNIFDERQRFAYLFAILKQSPNFFQNIVDRMDPELKFKFASYVSAEKGLAGRKIYLRILNSFPESEAGPYQRAQIQIVQAEFKNSLELIAFQSGIENFWNTAEGKREYLDLYRLYKADIQKYMREFAAMNLDQHCGEVVDEKLLKDLGKFSGFFKEVRETVRTLESADL